MASMACAWVGETSTDALVRPATVPPPFPRNRCRGLHTPSRYVASRARDGERVRDGHAARARQNTQAWAGKSSDISYYLNSHHVDFHEWCCSGIEGAAGTSDCAYLPQDVAQAKLGRPLRTTRGITLSVQWRTLATNALGHALYTSSWVAPKADVHSQQRWFYMGQSGEVTVDQAHRGYTVCTDSGGYGSVNPLF